MRVIRDNIATIVAGCVVVALFVASLVAFGPLRGIGPFGTNDAAKNDGALVVIHDGDGGVREVPLAENQRIEVVTSKGRNVIVVEDGAARMAEADCGHGDCLRQPAIRKLGERIVCLPHELWVEVDADGKDDGAAGGGSVDGESGESAGPDVDFVTG